MRKRLLAVLAAAMAIMTVAPATVSAETRVSKEIETLAKMQELDEAINPGKGAMAELWMYEGQIVQTTGTQGMLLPARCAGSLCNHLEMETENVPYEPPYDSARDLRDTEMYLDNPYCRIALVEDPTDYSYVEGDIYHYTNFVVYGIRAGEYTFTYRHYNSYISLVEDYEDEEGYYCVRELESGHDLEYTYTLKVHVLPQEVTQRYYTLKPGQVITPKTPVPVPTCYYVASSSWIDDIYTEYVKGENGKYEPILVLNENEDNVFFQQGNSLVARSEMVEYGQWISMFVPYYDYNGAYEDVGEYSRFHVTVSDTNLNVTKKTMKVGDSFKLRIKDGTTFSKVEAYYVTENGEDEFSYVDAGKSYATRSIYSEKGKQVIKFGTESKGYNKNDEAFKYVNVKATKKGTCLLKVYPYDNDKEYFFVCQITVK